MTPEQQQEILNLRALNLTPKQIARKLGLKNAEVAHFLRQQAEQAVQTQRQTTDGLDPVDRCLVNADMRRYLFPHADEPALTEAKRQLAEGGLALVTVVRKRGYNRFSLCAYLVDLGCMGVKDAQGPLQANGSECEQILAAMYKAFKEPPQRISLEQAQAIVFSALEYAQNLGFAPHADFAPIRYFLGEWDPNNRIPCGDKDGKPIFICGPYDHPQTVVDTLTKAVGEGNFKVVMPVP